MRRMLIVTAVAATIITIPLGAFAQQPNGVSPPNGYQWTVTFDDEFTQDSSINTSLWNGGASGLTGWCEGGGAYMFNEDPNNQCVDDYGTLNFDSYYGVEMSSTGSPSAAMNTGGPADGSCCALFIQQYGFWEASFMVPSNNDGEGGVANHSDFWMHPIPMDLSSCNTGGWTPEINVGERPSWPGGDTSNTVMAFSVHDCTDSSGAGGLYGDANNDDLSAGFHTYGMWWNNDGSPYGSIQMYLDGVALFSSPYTLSSSASNMANGIFMFLSVDNDGVGSAEPFNVQYVRVWRLDPQ